RRKRGRNHSALVASRLCSLISGKCRVAFFCHRQIVVDVLLIDDVGDIRKHLANERLSVWRHSRCPPSRNGMKLRNRHVLRLRRIAPTLSTNGVFSPPFLSPFALSVAERSRRVR